jgi:hypothetical protein
MGVIFTKIGSYAGLAAIYSQNRRFSMNRLSRGLYLVAGCAAILAFISCGDDSVWVLPESPPTTAGPVPSGYS